MIIINFIALNKRRAIRKAMDFWYKNFKKYTILKDFLANCTWRQEGKDFRITYRGPSPPEE